MSQDLPVPLPDKDISPEFVKLWDLIGEWHRVTVPMDHADKIDRQVHAMLESYARACMAPLQERADALQAENDENHALREKLSGLLSATVIALRGEPPHLTLWSWHDLPERAAAAIAAIDVMQRAAKENAARADALEEALRELVGARTEMDERAWTPDGFVDAKLYEAARDRMKSAWAAARSLINPTGGES